MRKITFLFLTTCLILTHLTVGYTQDADIDTLRASDVNADGVVNILDLTLVAAQFGTAPAADQPLNTDVNGDGTVNILDLTLVASHLGKTVSPPVMFISANPAIGSQLTVDNTITLTFDNTPEDVTVNKGTATIIDKTLEITGPFDPGALALTVTWTDGTETLDYTIRSPAAFVRANPAVNSELAVNDTITLTFDNPPEDVTVSTGDATVTDKTVEITGPFDPGALVLAVTWSDGTQMLNYTIRPPVTFVRANPAVRSQIAVDGTITLTFDNPPEDVTVSTGTVRTINKRVQITGPFDPGPLALTVTWTDGTQTLNYTVRLPDTEAPHVMGGTLSNGDTDVDPEAINSSGQIVVEFNEAVSGTIALQTESGADAGWRGKVEGNTATLQLIREKEIGKGTTYVIVGKVRDAADNETDLSITFTTIRPPVAFVSADPGTNSRLEADGTITLTFDNPPEDVTVSKGTATITDKTVEIMGPFDPGALALTITWTDGTETLDYTIRHPAAFVRVNPAVNSELAVNDTITLTFDNPPENVTVNKGTARTTRNRVRITGPFDPGALVLTVTWTDGTETLTYDVRVPDTDAPRITSTSVNNGAKDVDPDAFNTRGRIEVEFSEEVTGNVALQTAAGADVGWLGEVDGKKATLELVRGQELGNDVTYVIAGKVKDAAGNSTDINIRFTTARKIFETLFEVTDATFNSRVLGSEVPVLLEYVKDG